MHSAWKRTLARELKSDNFKKLCKFLKNEIGAGKVICPELKFIFRAFNFCSPEETKVVILGQDPYHTPGVANGLSFSISQGNGIPPSLLNIYREINQDLQLEEDPNHGDLTGWARQGVLLLNSCLTIEAYRPNSHKNKGWEQLTDTVISYLNKINKPIVFMLWGKEASQKETLITNPRHLVLKSSHPSPFSAHVTSESQIAFMGSKPFSSANRHLRKTRQTQIDWTLPDDTRTVKTKTASLSLVK